MVREFCCLICSFFLQAVIPQQRLGALIARALAFQLSHFREHLAQDGEGGAVGSGGFGADGQVFAEVLQHEARLKVSIKSPAHHV